jgi:3-oxoacyl-[acyl-carrier-protein] synthase III
MSAYFKSIAIESLAATLPDSVQRLDSAFLNIGSDDIDKITKVTGITQVSVSPAHVTALDLCIDAAEVLLANNPSCRAEIDAIIFVSQTRDYILPSSASIAQWKLGIKQDSLCIDVPSGCTGFLHGLFIASTFLSSDSVRKVLLLSGETNSKLINPADRTVSMIFGDGGSAAVLGKKSKHDSYFDFRTDGNGFESIIVPDGGSRSPFSSKSLVIRQVDNGNSRRPLDMKMDGLSVFNFALSSVPALVQETLSSLSLSPSSIDLFACHQANSLVVTQLRRKCGFTEGQAPFLASEFGNTGPASIPLLLTEGFSNSALKLDRVLMCGFGVGLNWGVHVANLSETMIYPTNFLA